MVHKGQILEVISEPYDSVNRYVLVIMVLTKGIVVAGANEDSTIVPGTFLTFEEIK